MTDPGCRRNSGERRSRQGRAEHGWRGPPGPRCGPRQRLGSATCC